VATTVLLRPGDRVRDYEILAQLASGGMATLFLARRQGPAGFVRLVAIKVVHPSLAGDRAAVRMFVEEALLSSRIAHPNVVRVEELLEQNGTYFLVMEYVHGASLAQLERALVERGERIPIAHAVAIAMSVAAALHAAHELRGAAGEVLGVVHRDVTPHNVLLSRDGHVKLIDFGIAKVQGRARTKTGHLRGKVRYMSPEQAAAGAIDRRSDVYTLGIVLWEMLTMRRRFDEADHLALLTAVQEPTPLPVRALATDVPEALDEIVTRALSRDPAARPASALELQRALARILPDALGVDAPEMARFVGSVLAAELESVSQEVALVVEDAADLFEPTKPDISGRT